MLCNQTSDGSMVPPPSKDKKYDILSAQGCCTPLGADLGGDEVMVE
jgi:hypothetical protein